MGIYPRTVSNDGHHAGMLGLLFRLHVNRNHRVVDFRFQSSLDPVAEIVRFGNGHAPGHDEMKVNEVCPSGMPGPEIMGFDRAARMRGDDVPHLCQCRFRQRLVHQTANGLAQ